MKSKMKAQSREPVSLKGRNRVAAQKSGLQLRAYCLQSVWDVAKTCAKQSLSSLHHLKHITLGNLHALNSSGADE